jgi:putative toxin-antitoxin system antitoxin component (TIGR02293 family)
MSTAAVHARAQLSPAERHPARGARTASLVAAEPALAGYHVRTDPSSNVTRVMDMMGGRKVLKAAPLNRADIHALIKSGLPTRSVDALVGGAVVLKSSQMLDAIGISLRTFQRFKGARDGSLSSEQSDRAWRLSELLVKAAELFGSKEEAERWFDTPAPALERNKPIELMSSSVGARMVEQLLGRIEHGVYT